MNILCKGSNSRKLQKSLQIIAEDGRAKVAYNFFAAFPGSGWRDFFSAIWFLFKVKIRLGKRLIRYKFSYLRPEPGTPLAKIIYGEENPTCLLPRNRKELSKLFFRHSASPILNIFLHLHYHSGCIFGKKNTL
jgi:radical SAM superfamily enzyme YgiQ (UPF0313 family)